MNSHRGHIGEGYEWDACREFSSGKPFMRFYDFGLFGGSTSKSSTATEQDTATASDQAAAGAGKNSSAGSGGSLVLGGSAKNNQVATGNAVLLSAGRDQNLGVQYGNKGNVTINNTNSTDPVLQQGVLSALQSSLQLAGSATANSAAAVQGINASNAAGAVQYQSADGLNVPTLPTWLKDVLIGAAILGSLFLGLFAWRTFKK